ncbi:MAG: PAS domain-containing protein [Desulfobacteraceae bacterium]|nr:MAG: PAS domain-containing protein [Desulfobacteraceae bacterium]
MKAPPYEKLVFYEQLWSMLGDLHIGVFTVDSDRRITSFNRAAELLTGYKEEEVIGKYCHEVLINDLCRGECRFHEAVEAEQSSLSFDLEFSDRHFERRAITKIVTPLYNLKHDLIGCMEIFQDRSAFAELIDRVHYGERRLKIILDNLEIAVFTVTRGGLFTFFNTVAEKLSGFQREEVLGKPCSMLLGQGASLMRQAVDEEKTLSNKKGTLTAKSRRQIPVRGNYMALKNEKGRIIGGLATIQDLSLIDRLQRAINSKYTFGDMIGRDPAMQRIFDTVPVIADSEATVLIEGATGTGKDLLAKVIHNSSKRAKRPLVNVNCAALPDTLLESEMFGYVKGAFTGALKDKPGRFHEADGGTIFLDEIGDLPLPLQAKLLRVLEDKEFYSLGSRKTTRVDVRIIAATNQGLDRMVEAKKFRQDLFYRLNVIRLEIPPLRERRGDIPLLIDHIMGLLTTTRKARAQAISEDAMEILLGYDYPGNVRELENILEHAIIICQEEMIEPRHLPAFLKRRPLPEPHPRRQVESVRGADGEREKIIAALEKHQWNRARAAGELRMDRTTLWRKMKRYRLQP